MKLAVLVCGMYREFYTSIQTWKFIDSMDCDFYFSTWDKSIQKNERLGFDLNEDVTSEMIKKIIPHANVNVLKQSDYDFSSDIFYHNAKQIFHWKNAYKMMIDSGVNYDMIMITRTDNYKSYSDSYQKFNSFNKSDRIYGLTPIYISGPSQYFLLDYFFVGGFEPMSRMITTLPNEMPGNIHGDLSKHLLSINLFVEEIKGFDLSLVRPNTRDIFPLNMEIVQNKFREWGINTGN